MILTSNQFGASLGIDIDLWSIFADQRKASIVWTASVKAIH